MNLRNLITARLQLALLLLALAFAGWGCRSPEGGTASSFAAVMIKDREEMDIRATTAQIFEKHGYTKSLTASPAGMTFDKPGTMMNTLVYGGWMGKEWVRVRVYAEPEPTGGFVLRCEAFMVGDHDDPLVEEEHKLTWIRRGPYQKLLEEIKASLASPR